jgi:hypothetical protein
MPLIMTVTLDKLDLHMMAFYASCRRCHLQLKHYHPPARYIVVAYANSRYGGKSPMQWRTDHVEFCTSLIDGSGAVMKAESPPRQSYRPHKCKPSK